MNCKYQHDSCSQDFRIARNQCCNGHVHCSTQRTADTSKIRPNMMSNYITEVNRGLGGLIQCYVAGIQCLCNTLEAVAEELCDKRAYIRCPQDQGDREIADSKANFCKTFKETFNPLFIKLEAETDKVGERHGKSAQAKVIGAYQKWWQDEVTQIAEKMVESIPKFVNEQEREILAEKKAKQDQAKTIQHLTQRVERLEKENEELRKARGKT